MPKIRLKHAVEEIHKVGSELHSVSQSSHNYDLNPHNWWVQVYKSNCYSSCHNYSGLGSPRIWISRGMPSSFSPSTRLNSVMIIVFMLGCTDSVLLIILQVYYSDAIFSLPHIARQSFFSHPYIAEQSFFSLSHILYTTRFRSVYVYIDWAFGLVCQVGKCVEIGIPALLFILLFSQVKC